MHCLDGATEFVTMNSVGAEVLQNHDVSVDTIVPHTTCQVHSCLLMEQPQYHEPVNTTATALVQPIAHCHMI